VKWIEMAVEQRMCVGIVPTFIGAGVPERVKLGTIGYKYFTL
jgi:hypothetical protein